MNRTFVIGDIHGALRALKELLELIQPRPEDLLIFLGDYVDSWSEAAQTVDYLIELKSQCRCIFLRGNHDKWCEDWLAGRAIKEELVWLQSGGITTQQSYANYPAEQRRRHSEFFASLINYHIDNENRLFIHAGFASMHGPLKEHYETNYYWDRSLWEMALSMDSSLPVDHPFYPKRLKNFREIYIGHTPTTNYGIETPVNRANLWNVDTGAGFGKRLTALNIDTKEFLQSTPVAKLYPGEAGRNR